MSGALDMSWSGKVGRVTGEKTMLDLTCNCEDARDSVLTCDSIVRDRHNKPPRHRTAFDRRCEYVLIVPYRQT